MSRYSIMAEVLKDEIDDQFLSGNISSVEAATLTFDVSSGAASLEDMLNLFRAKRKELDERIAGKKHGPITLRRTDEFKLLADKINRLINK